MERAGSTQLGRDAGSRMQGTSAEPSGMPQRKRLQPAGAAADVLLQVKGKGTALVCLVLKEKEDGARLCQMLCRMGARPGMVPAAVAPEDDTWIREFLCTDCGWAGLPKPWLTDALSYGSREENRTGPLWSPCTSTGNGSGANVASCGYVAAPDESCEHSSSRPAEDCLRRQLKSAASPSSELAGSSPNHCSKGAQLAESLEQREEPAAAPAPGGHHQSL